MQKTTVYSHTYVDTYIHTYTDAQHVNNLEIII